MKKILLVEDNEMNQDMLSRRLLRRGYDVIFAMNGEESISIALSEQPDLILMDMSLPVMDGWEATRRLKANARTVAIPIIALTAHAMAGDFDKAMAAGCDDYATKPVELPQLLQKMETLLTRSGPIEVPVIEQEAILNKEDKGAEEIELQVTSVKESKQVVSEEVIPKDGSLSATLLIVDDNDENLDMLSRRLLRAGYKVLLATSGEEGLEIIRKQAVDLVLLDIMMPGISGLETLKLIREIHSKVELPTIMATAKDRSEDIVQAFDLGANDYITKPIDFPVTLARIQSQLNTIKAARAEQIGMSAVIEPTDPPTPQVGSATHLLAARYSIIRLLAQDEFSNIYLAQDTQQPGSSACAIEQLSINIENKPDLWESARYLFREEAQRLKLLGAKGGNSSIYNCFDLNRSFYIVREYTEGTLLSEEIPGRSGDFGYTVNLVSRAFKALDPFHQNRIAHQDLQPSSFMRCKLGQQLILFNLGIGARLNKTLSQKYGLTPAIDPRKKMYAPPEQGSDQQTLSEDVYSVGAIALHALTGYEPAKVLTNPKIRQHFWRQLSEKNDNFARIFQKMLHEDPQERYQSARDALNEISLQKQI